MATWGATAAARRGSGRRRFRWPGAVCCGRDASGSAGSMVLLVAKVISGRGRSPRPDLRGHSVPPPISARSAGGSLALHVMDREGSSSAHVTTKGLDGPDRAHRSRLPVRLLVNSSSLPGSFGSKDPRRRPASRPVLDRGPAMARIESRASEMSVSTWFCLLTKEATVMRAPFALRVHSSAGGGGRVAHTTIEEL